ncbi:MAG: ABC transporter ATP-binding protein, partial [Rhodocyclaceae bacterium]|nr:ABC transporter ATP-binding protein [Rhodocyclaceae bacterium]
NGCVPNMSVADNMALRNFDMAPFSAGWGGGRRLKRGRITRRAKELIEAFGVRPPNPATAIENLSGGNVQRAVLARELAQQVKLLVVANPVFGLDFAATEAIHRRLDEARNNGAAILLVSEDLDELLELSDRILVMSEGKVAYATPVESADVAEIGRHMAGHGH